MQLNDLHQLAILMGVSDKNALFIVTIILLWSLYWKWRSLWIASEHKDKVWFTVLLIANTVGILDMAYIYLLAKPGDEEYEAVDVKNRLE